MIYTVTFAPAVDKSLVIDDFAAGKVNRVRDMRLDAGGKGINVSKTLKSLGANNVAMGIVGGESGRFIEKTLNEMGIATDLVISKRETRTNIKISDPISKTTTDINEKGIYDKEDSDALLARIMSAIKPNDLVVLAGKINTEITDVEKFIKDIQGKGAKVLLDSEGAALKSGVKAKPFLIKPNREEFLSLIGANETDTNNTVLLAKSYREETGLKCLALSLGEKGAAFFSENACYIADALPVEPKCSVGAGDSMMAALCFGIENDLSFEKGCALAIATSAAAVACPGTQSPDRETIYGLLPKVKLRSII